MKRSGTGGTKGFQHHYLVWLTEKELRVLERIIEEAQRGFIDR